MPEIKRERVPNVRPKVRKRAKAMYLGFVLLDLEYAKIKRGAKRIGRSVDT